MIMWILEITRDKPVLQWAELCSVTCEMLKKLSINAGFKSSSDWSGGNTLANFEKGVRNMFNSSLRMKSEAHNAKAVSAFLVLKLLGELLAILIIKCSWTKLKVEYN